MRRSVLITMCILLVISAIFSGCSRNARLSDDSDSDKPSEERTEDSKSFFEAKEDSTSEPEEQEATEQPAEPTPDPNIVQPGDIIFTGRESIVFEYYVEDPTGKTTMKVTMSEGYIRVDIPDIDVVGVMNTNDDTGFVYYKSKFGKVSMSFYNLGSVESINQLNLVCENVDDVENLERTTLDGRECIYGELEDDGDVLKLWYSEEYHILLQYILDSSEGISTMKVTSVEEFNGDMSVFEIPAGCIDLGTYDAEGEAFSEITDDLE